MHSLARFVRTFLLFCITSSAIAQETGVPPATDAPPKSLIVAIREVPPFAMKSPSGNWEGMSVDLWHEMATNLGLKFEWQELSLSDTLKSLKDGKTDVAITALTVTTERERDIDFTHPYYFSGLALGHAGNAESPWFATLRGFVSAQFLSTVASLALVLLLAGFSVWLFERKANHSEFGGGLRGLGAGFWWSAVTMTTVGYGDKSPKTVGGRVVALIWMFTSLIIIAGFTATIAASLTAHRLNNDALENRKLSDLKVSVLGESNADGYATRAGARVRRFDTLNEALSAVQKGEVDAIIHDEPVLRYRSRKDQDWLVISDRMLTRDDYGFGLTNGSMLREKLNGALISILHEPIWNEIRERYLGDSTDPN